MDLPNSFKAWKVSYDPYGFATESNWLDHSERVEDILQIQLRGESGIIIDVGYYSDTFSAAVIKHLNWDEPVESIRSPNTKEIVEWVYSAMDRYSK